MHDQNRYLQKRGNRWHYVRRVPKEYEQFHSEAYVRKSLKTTAVEVARARRDALVEADDHYWASLVYSDDKADEAVLKRYEAAQRRALAKGFMYVPMNDLVSSPDATQLLERLEALENGNANEPIPKRDVEALLGMASEPVLAADTVSKAFDLYVSTIAFDAQLKKSPAQQKSWEKAKRTSVEYFISSIGNLQMSDITREHALDYRNWWMERIANGDENEQCPTPYTANRHIGNMRSLYGDYFAYKGEEDRPNPFRKLSFKESRSSKKKRPPFDTNWIRDKILVPGLFMKVNDEARHILYTLVETGARPSEICNLRPENIRLDEPVPYIAIRESNNREIKADASDRDIPLVGISLAAMKHHPDGFPRYFDKETSLSAILMKSFKARNLLPTKDHKIYSLRHSFEKRMLEAGLDYGLRCTLMGHKNERPEYGDGGSIKYRCEELKKIAFPYDGWEI